MDNNKPVAAIIGLLGALAGVVLCIVSAATNKWMTSDKDPSITVSIQEVCDEDGCITNEGFWRVAATLVIGIIKACIAVLLACIALCCMRQPENMNCSIRRLLLAGGILGILGALSVGIACLIFATADEDLRSENFDIALGYSFYLAVVGAVLIFIAAIVLLCARPPLQAVAVVFSMPPANVVAMQSTSVYGYDQGPINMEAHPQLPPSYYPPPAPAGYENERRFEKM